MAKPTVLRYADGPVAQVAIYPLRQGVIKAMACITIRIEGREAFRLGGLRIREGEDGRVMLSSPMIKFPGGWTPLIATLDPAWRSTVERKILQAYGRAHPQAVIYEPVEPGP